VPKGKACGRAERFQLAAFADAPPDAVSERALYGRATCRAQMGDGQGRALTSKTISRDSDRTIRDQARH